MHMPLHMLGRVQAFGNRASALQWPLRHDEQHIMEEMIDPGKGGVGSDK